MAEDESCILDARSVERAIRRIAMEIIERNKTVERLAVVGIEPRGVALAARIAGEINKAETSDLPLGSLDISLYRDDLDEKPLRTVERGTEINFDVTDRNLILVDDVLYTGRSIRAAMDQLMDLGRPRSIQLAVLIDRGHRELPIAADYVGKAVETLGTDHVAVRLNETHGVDEAVLVRG
jgi:pyrimidine operon attenuation protein/uracil phosphoribosyltransferase